jgi:hypothetical protein
MDHPILKLEKGLLSTWLGVVEKQDEKHKKNKDK